MGCLFELLKLLFYGSLLIGLLVLVYVISPLQGILMTIGIIAAIVFTIVYNKTMKK